MPYWDCACSLNEHYLIGFNALKNNQATKGFVYRIGKYKRFKVILD